tara:strand:+ start:55 stop:387 length:333 start_codon:yes stop_codon:yes gene_type:complete
MSIPKFDIVIYQGDDAFQDFIYKADDVEVDISDYVIRMECDNPAFNRLATIADQTTDTGLYTFNFVAADTAETQSRNVGYEVIYYPSGLEGPRNTKHGGVIEIVTEVDNA